MSEQSNPLADNNFKSFNHQKNIYIHHGKKQEIFASRK